MLKDAVTCDVVASLCDILLDALEDFAIVYAGGLQEAHEIVLAEPSVWTTVALAAARDIGDELLA